eukprot:4238357-Pleurochrysis_carterae.AAC.2
MDSARTLLPKIVISSVFCRNSLLQVRLDKTREGYKPTAFRASLLFFCISDLANVDPMYQYSLSWYIGIFERAIDDATPSKDLNERLEALKAQNTLSVYRNVCRSLYEKDKLLFSFLMCAKIMQARTGCGPRSRGLAPPPDLLARFALSSPSPQAKCPPCSAVFHEWCARAGQRATRAFALHVLLDWRLGAAARRCAQEPVRGVAARARVGGAAPALAGARVATRAPLVVRARACV